MRTIVTTERDRESFIEKVRAFPLGKKQFVAEFKVYRKVRSLKANKLYWLWLRCIKDETGNDEETLHTYFKNNHLSWSLKTVFDKEVTMTPSTKNLDSKQFSEYLEKVKIEMLEQGIFLPNPDDKGWDEFYTRYGLN
ncbi:MAG: hypothetical protein IMZ58_08505 [Thermoplasmata archaeon]|nr:hypothetical protein [Thermoplasmata archaeon]